MPPSADTSVALPHRPVLAARPAVFPLLLGLAAALLQLHPDAPAALEFDRAAIAGGQAWRLLSGHLVHWSADHLFWSGGALVLLGVLCHRAAPRRLIPCALASAVVISAALWFGSDLRLYRGASGVDSALFALLAVGLLREKLAQRNRAGAATVVLLLLAFLAKCALETVTGRAVFVDSAASDMVPVPLAHLVGAGVGLAFGLRCPCHIEGRRPADAHG